MYRDYQQTENSRLEMMSEIRRRRFTWCIRKDMEGAVYFREHIERK